MTFSFAQSLLDLPENSGRRAPFPFEQAQTVPKPNEFGKMVKLQEAEDQIVIDYQVYDRRPSDSDLLIAAIETHRAMLGRPPHMVAADAAFYSAERGSS